MPKRVTVTLTEKEALEASSALFAELRRQEKDPTRTRHEIAAIERAAIKLLTRD